MWDAETGTMECGSTHGLATRQGNGNVDAGWCRAYMRGHRHRGDRATGIGDLDVRRYGFKDAAARGQRALQKEPRMRDHGGGCHGCRPSFDCKARRRVPDEVDQTALGTATKRDASGSAAWDGRGGRRAGYNT